MSAHWYNQPNPTHPSERKFMSKSASNAIINGTAIAMAIALAVGYFASQTVRQLVAMFWPAAVGALVLSGVGVALGLTVMRVIRPLPAKACTAITGASLIGVIASITALFVVKSGVTLEDCPLFWPLLISAFVFVLATLASFGLRAKEGEAELAAFLQKQQEAGVVG
jgi:FtsH-binding integral membrane protein